MARVYTEADEFSIEQLEEVLDFLAHAIDKSKDGGEGFFPIWNRIEHEIKLREEKRDIRSAVRERIRRSADQTAA
jgi:hypothetical protein